ncbi:pseudouridine synthase [Catenovulum maritimum]|uniref:tRNA pseudouridine synthase B n=1 Tax=Catenovulum maritimum TaxID=1513271 RepID=A0A0J8GTR1_9ALTE|nr:tRNA pseudouridine(55) synthase TruB [Catenovulum maritimum]KMT64078.1 pseudouridine synthase [Catenovulum maritimum]
MARVPFRDLDGVVLLDKPKGISSNRALQNVRFLYRAKKAGHTGALDPLATGLLPICFGEATKFSQFLLDADKVYQVTAKLGERTDTSDAEGEVVQIRPTEQLTVEEIEDAIKSFVGKQSQMPSIYSALKYQGKPLYFYARQGIEVPRPVREIEVYFINIDEIDLPNVTMTISCSKGTYIRTIVDDLGEKLGCGAHVAELRRTEVFGFSESDILSLEAFEALSEAELEARLLGSDAGISYMPIIELDDEHAARLGNGQRFYVEQEPGSYRAYNQNTNQFLGVVQVEDNKLLQPKRMMSVQS